MLTRLTIAAALLVVPALPAAAQNAAPPAATADPDARFRIAQERLERELQLFRREYDLYQSMRRLPPGYAQPRYDDRRAAPRLPDPSYGAPYADDDRWDGDQDQGPMPYDGPDDYGPQ